MADRRLLNAAIQEIRGNLEQLEAVFEGGHCVVLAGPGSGKTKTLTIAMARALLEDVREPRGIACITYNNECAIELETRLSRLGVEPGERVFIGTILSFALTQVILPYARCAMPEIATGIRVANRSECR
ncbi:MAG TPA: UvrD-helicase domain-containing protein, partial [Syntrophobacteraceae bacterium]|nr:UvrD-helicase domain-containing protein [Syntrophobacteraceae bacterium]